MKRFILFMVGVLFTLTTFGQSPVVALIQNTYVESATPVEQYYTFNGTATSEMSMAVTPFLDGLVSQSWAIKMSIQGFSVEQGIIGELGDSNDIKWEIDADDNRMDVSLTQGAASSSMTNVDYFAPDIAAKWWFLTYDNTTGITVYDQEKLLKTTADIDFQGWVANQYLTVGSGAASVKHMVGDIYEIQIYDHALSTAEREQIVTDPTNTPSGLVANFADNKTIDAWTDDVGGYELLNQGAVTGGVAPAEFFDLSEGITLMYETDLNESNVQDIYWDKTDGSRFWIVGATCDCVEEWSTVTDWSINGATETKNFSVATQEVVPTGLWWHPSGDFFFITGLGGDGFDRYDVSTSWDIDTATHTAFGGAVGGGFYGLEFEPDGFHVWAAYSSGGWWLRRYELATAWDVTTINTADIRRAFFDTDKVSNFGWNEDGFQLWYAAENTGQLKIFSLENQYDPTYRTLLYDIDTDYSSNLRAGEFVHGNFDTFYVGGAGTNVEMKQYRINAFDDGQTLGPNLITNGTFDTDTDWTKLSNWTISGGKAQALVATSGQLRQNQGFGAATYRIDFDMTISSTGNIQTRINGSTYTKEQRAVGHKTFYYTAPAGSGWFDINGGAGFIGTIDNATVRLVTP